VALILGTGGASKAVALALKKLHIRFQFVSSSQQNENTLSYLSLDKEMIRHSTLIINTTPWACIPIQIKSLPYLMDI